MKTDFCILEGSQGVGLGGGDGFGGSEGFLHTGAVNCLEAATTFRFKVFYPHATSRGNLADLAAPWLAIGETQGVHAVYDAIDAWWKSASTK